MEISWRSGLLRLNEKASKAVLDPLEASYCHLLKTPPSHFYASEGYRLDWDVFCERGIVYNSNGSRTENSVKRNFSLSSGLK